MLGRLDELKTRLLTWLWASERLAGHNRLGGAGVRALRIAHCVLRDLAAGEITLQAMSLVYTTLLALVPLLAVSFSVLKAFGVHDRAKPILLDFLQPLGERGQDLSAEIVNWVERLDVGVLGGLGVAFLIYSVISLIQKIETAFNQAWHVNQRQRFLKRFGDYLSMILLGPVLIFAAVSTVAQVLKTQLATSLLSWGPAALLAQLGAGLLPYLLAIAAFTLIYLYVPNTRVRLRSALAGAAVSGSVWQSVGWLFASVVVSSARYSGFYSGFAIVLLFMIWLYVNWTLLLLGASIGFYHQNPDYMGLDPLRMRLSGRLRERLALLVMSLIGRRHFARGQRWTIETLAQHLGMPSDAVGRILGVLEEHGLLAVSGENDDEYLPGKALETVTIRELLETVRSADEGPLLEPQRLPPDAAVDSVIDELDRAAERTLGSRTLRDLVVHELPTAEVPEMPPGEG